MTKRGTHPPMPVELQRRMGTIDRFTHSQQQKLQQSQLNQSKSFRDKFKKR